MSDVVVIGNVGEDTNGAGDSLAVGFLSRYVLDGYGLEDAILRGQIAARHACVSRHACTLRGTSDGLIDRERLDALFAERRA